METYVFQQQQPGSPWQVHGKISHIGARSSSGEAATAATSAATAMKMVAKRMVWMDGSG
jgi:hypothetical protein